MQQLRETSGVTVVEGVDHIARDTRRAPGAILALVYEKSGSLGVAAGVLDPGDVHRLRLGDEDANVLAKVRVDDAVHI